MTALPLPAFAQARAETDAAAPARTPAPPRELVAAPARQRLRPSQETAIWTFDGGAAAPPLRLRRGESVTLGLVNKTERPLSLHWHGLRGDNAMDGVGGMTQEPVAPGARFDYRLTPPDSGTILYRPLLLGGSSEPAGRGLAGLLVVEEETPPVVDLDLPVLVQDWLLDDGGAIAAFDASAPQGAGGGRLGSWLTVNGAAPPHQIKLRPGSRVRLRLANACNARIMRLRFDGLTAHVVAVDSQPTDTFEPVRAQLPFAPGTRYDVIVELPEQEGASASLMALIGAGLPLVRFVCEGKPLAKREALVALAPNPALPAAVRLQDARRADIVIEGGARIGADNRLDLGAVDPKRPWAINGKVGAAGDKPLLSVKRGTPLVLAVTNRTDFMQPLHVHGHSVRLLHPLDDGWEPYFLDTVQIPDGKRLHIAFIADNPGRWLISSTILERFDLGMWTWFEVT
ncbi:multicopper oxidase family protein [Bosea sp. TWI1241]|uniref:multicopper oxidase family protein n=1 Tax=Bosea sp. TWI1241 TaxID=3148904 RepID=UPI00320AC49B